MTETLFRLDIWRPARPDRQLFYAGRDDDKLSVIELHEDHLHEQAYSWNIREDVWSDKAASRIRDMLTTDFDCSLPPEIRSFNKMKDVVSELGNYLVDESKRQWQSCLQPVRQDDPNNVFQIQPLLSLYHHLKWLCEVFCNVPGASVTVR